MINNNITTSPFFQETHETLQAVSFTPTIGGLLLSCFGVNCAVYSGSLASSLFSVTVGAATITCTPLIVIIAGVVLFAVGLAAVLYFSHSEPKKLSLRTPDALNLRTPEEQNIIDYRDCYSQIQSVFQECHTEMDQLPHEEWINREAGEEDYFKFPVNRLSELNHRIYRGRATERDFLLIKVDSERAVYLQQRFQWRPYYWVACTVGQYNFPSGNLEEPHFELLRSALVEN